MNENTQNGYSLLMELVIKDHEAATILAAKIPRDKLSFSELFVFLSSEHVAVKHMAQNLIREIPSSKLSSRKLKKLQKTANVEIRQLLRALLLKHFSNALSFKMLLGFYSEQVKFGYYDSLTRAEKSILSLPKDKLNLQQLLKVRMTKKDWDIRRIATRLLLKHFFDQFNLKGLINLYDKSRFNSDMQKLLWQTAAQLSPEKLDFEILIQNFKAPCWTSDTEYIIDDIFSKLMKSQLNYERLIELYESPDSKEDKTVVRFLLLTHFSEKLSFDMLVKFQQRSGWLNGNNIVELSRELLLKRFPQNLDINVLAHLRMSDKPQIKKEAEHLINELPENSFKPNILLKLIRQFNSSNALDDLAARVPIDKLSFKNLLPYFSDVKTNRLVEALILRLPVEKLDFEELVEQYHFHTVEWYKNFWSRLLMKHFPDRLDYKLLLEFQTSNFEDVWETARDLALALPVSSLELSSLINAYDSDNERVSNLARELALMIPADKIDFETIVKACKSRDNEKYDEIGNFYLICELADKIPAESLDASRLTELRNIKGGYYSNYSALKQIVETLLKKHFFEKMQNTEKEILECFA